MSKKRVLWHREPFEHTIYQLFYFFLLLNCSSKHKLTTALHQLKYVDGLHGEDW